MKTYNYELKKQLVSLKMYFKGFKRNKYIKMQIY